MTGLVVILFEEDESFELIPGTMRGIVVMDLLGGFKGLKSDADFFEKGVWDIYIYFFRYRWTDIRSLGALEGFLFPGLAK